MTLDTLVNFSHDGNRLFGISRDFIAIYVYIALRAFNCVRHGKILDKRPIILFPKDLPPIAMDSR